MTGRVQRAPRFVYLTDVGRSGGSPSRVGWRLVAANNRPLGRALHAEESLAACMASAARIHEHAATATASASFHAPSGQWTWTVALDGAPVAVGSHPYLRRVECVRAVAQFLAAAQAADPDLGVVRQFGPHTLREYATAPAPDLAR